ncbi:GlsB/YeaQ/YmgE family stress response membrane protein [bacterium]|nr:GlsB/YeaQ/YmgE family stress response membrane protein [bacterium]
MSALGWIFMGLLAGWLARFIMPGRQGGGLIVTMIIGIVGAAIGGWVGTQLGWGTVNDFDLKSLGLAVLGGVVLLMILGAIRGR